MIYNNVLDLIGNTPLVKINKINEGCAKIYAKIEYFNPTGSIKDRIAYAMIKNAQDKGLIEPHKSTIIEPTSGNTGIGLAMVCSILGYDLILTMPDSMSKERRDILKAYGAKLDLTPAKLGMQGACDRAYELNKQIKNSYIPEQFSNSANPAIHYETTANEIWKDTQGHIDIIIAGFGTGGTISGVSKRLKELNPNLYSVALEPQNSPLITQGRASSHKIQGIGANFVPKNLDLSYVDEVIAISDEDAIEYTKKLACKEGLFCGISSGAAVKCAEIVSKREENKDKVIVVILPDSGMRYLSCDIF